MPEAIDRFLSRYTIQDSEKCWEWKGRLNADGYGEFDVDNKTVRAHRYMWENQYGDIPDGLCICHECDNRKCVNPHHLFLGTVGDNNRDRHEKGRDGFKSRPGTEHNMVKLTEEQVRWIRDSVGPISVQAKAFDISEAQVSRIKNRKTWKHLV